MENSIDSVALRLSKISIQNFRKFEQFSIKFDDRLTVLTGDNAAGKTTLLDAASIALGSLFTRIENAAGKSIALGDVRKVVSELGSSSDSQWQFPAVVRAEGCVSGQEMSWERSLNSQKSKTTTANAKNIIREGERLQERVARGDDGLVLPIVAYYGTGRLWTQKPSSVNLDKVDFSSTRTRGYENCLSAKVDEAAMYAWFRKMALWEWQHGAKSPEFTAVKTAVANCFTFVSQTESVRLDFDVQLQELVMSYRSGDGMLHRDSLHDMSDGYRNTLSMVTDIAYRMATLNPGLLDRVLETPGIVLIDEVDLHLHPLWQARILGDLSKAFPNVQFIVTTHAPMVVSSVDRRCVRLLNGSTEATEPPAQTYGSDANSVLRLVMGSTERQRSVEDRFEEFYKLLDDGDYDQAGLILDGLQQDIGESDNELVAARTALFLDRP